MNAAIGTLEAEQQGDGNGKQRELATIGSWAGCRSRGLSDQRNDGQRRYGLQRDDVGEQGAFQDQGAEHDDAQEDADGDGDGQTGQRDGQRDDGAFQEFPLTSATAKASLHRA